MKKKSKKESKPIMPESKKASSDLKIRLISATVLFFLIIVYIGVGAVYTETTLPAREVGAWFNFAISLGLIGLGMYELLKMLNIGTKETWYIPALAIFLAELFFIFPLDGHLNQPLYDPLHNYLQIENWLHWYVTLMFVIVMLLGLFLIGYFTGSAISGLYLVIYGTLIVLGFKGFSVISLSLAPKFGVNSIIFAWGTVILTDSFAYLGGRKFGKTKLAPDVSPKKTWEGAGIGTGVAVVIAVIYGSLFYYLYPSFSPFDAMLTKLDRTWTGLPGIMIFLLALLISIMGQLGDLVFSYLKRVYNKKDYSNLIPGHGGILDRFDSFIVVFAILYFIVLSSSGPGVM